MARSAQAARGAMGREEGEREWGTLLVDVVRDHEVSLVAVSSTALAELSRFAGSMGRCPARPFARSSLHLLPSLTTGATSALRSPPPHPLLQASRPR